LASDVLSGSGLRCIFKQDLPDDSKLSKDGKANNSISIVPNVPPFQIRSGDEHLKALDYRAKGKDSGGPKREGSWDSCGGTREQRRQPNPAMCHQRWAREGVAEMPSADLVPSHCFAGGRNEPITSTAM